MRWSWIIFSRTLICYHNSKKKTVSLCKSNEGMGTFSTESKAQHRNSGIQLKDYIVVLNNNGHCANFHESKKTSRCMLRISLFCHCWSEYVCPEHICRDNIAAYKWLLTVHFIPRNCTKFMPRDIFTPPALLESCRETEVSETNSCHGISGGHGNWNWSYETQRPWLSLDGRVMRGAWREHWNKSRSHIYQTTLEGSLAGDWSYSWVVGIRDPGSRILLASMVDIVVDFDVTCCGFWFLYVL